MTNEDPAERLSAVLRWIRITLLSAASISLLLTAFAAATSLLQAFSSRSFDAGTLASYLFCASPAVFFWGYLKDVLRNEDYRPEWGRKPLRFHFAASLYHWIVMAILIMVLALAKGTYPGLALALGKTSIQWASSPLDEVILSMMGLANLVWIPLAASLSAVSFVILSYKRSRTIRNPLADKLRQGG